MAQPPRRPDEWKWEMSLRPDPLPLGLLRFLRDRPGMDLGELRTAYLGQVEFHKRHARYEQLDAELHALIKAEKIILQPVTDPQTGRTARVLYFARPDP
jgi:hypothetical protein